MRRLITFGYLDNAVLAACGSDNNSSRNSADLYAMPEMSITLAVNSRTIFTDQHLCAVIVDRLTFGGTIIETSTDSYRLSKTKSAQLGGQ